VHQLEDGAVAVIGTISIALEDDSARFTQSMERNAALVTQQSQRMERGLGGVAKSVDDLNRKASSFQSDPFRALGASALRAQNNVERLQRTILALTAAAGGGFAGAVALKSLTETADRYTNIQNRIAAIVQTGQQRADVEANIFRIAQETRTSYEATAQLFQRISMGANMLGATQKQVLEVTETVNKALQSGGATTAEAASAAVQFSQALGSGRLAGDELRSILENSQVLSAAIAKEFGVSVAALHDMGAEGQLTSDRVFKAILSAGVDIDKQFKALRPTIQQSMQVLDNAFTQYIGQVDKSLGVSNAMAQGIIGLANNLKTLGDVAMAVAPLVAAVFANRVVGRAGRAAGRAISSPFAAAAEQAGQEIKDAEALAAAARQRRQAAGAALGQFAEQPVLVQASAQSRNALSDAVLKANADQERAAKALTGVLALEEKKRELIDNNEIRSAEAKARRLAAIDERIAAARAAHAAAESAASFSRAQVATATEAVAQSAVANQSRLSREAVDALKAEDEAHRAVAATVEKNTRSFIALSGAKSVLLRSATGLVDFLGGPWGVVFTAVIAGLGLYELGQIKGAEAAERHKKALDGLADRLKALREEQTKGAIRSVSDVAGDQASLRESAKGVRDIRERIRQETAGLQYGRGSQRTQEQAEQLGISMGQILATLRVGGPLSQETVGALGDLTRLAEFLQREGTPEAQKHAQAILKLADEYASARARVLEFEGAARTAAARTVQASGRQSVYDTDFKPDVIGLRIDREMEAQRQLNDQDPALRIPTGIELTDQINKEIEDAKNAIRREWGDGIDDPAMRVPTGIEITESLQADLQKAKDTLQKALSNIGQDEFDTAAKQIGTSSSEIIKVLSDTKSPAEQTAKAVEDLARVLANLSGTRLDLSGPIDEAVRAAQAFLTAAGSAAQLAGSFAQVAQARANAEAARRIDQMVGAPEPAAVPDIVRSQVEANILRRADKKDSGLEDQDRATEIQNQNRGMFTKDQALDLARRERALQDAKAPKAGRKPKETPEERLSERIKRIREESDSAFLPELDKDVIAEITKTKGTAGIAANVRKQLEAGKPLTGEFADLKSAVTAREAAKEYKNIVQEYGNMAQVTPFVRTEQEKLNFLLKDQHINAMQAGSALADYMSKFKEFQWIDKLTDSLKSFGDTLADTLYDGKLNADTFAEAVNNLGKALFKLVLNETAIEPLRQMLRGGLANAFAPGGGGLAGLFGGGGGGTDTATTLGLYHVGGLVGYPRQMRTVSESLLRDAPHYAGGLRPGEFAAILHQGESVLTKRQTEGYAAMAGALSNMQGGYNVTINEAPGTQAQVSQGENGGLQVDILSLAEAGLADRMARGRGPLAKASRAGGRSNLRG